MIIGCYSLQKWNRHLFVLTPNKLYYSEEQETPRDDDDDYDDGSEDKQNRLDVSAPLLSQVVFVLLSILYRILRSPMFLYLLRENVNPCPLYFNNAQLGNVPKRRTESTCPR